MKIQIPKPFMLYVFSVLTMFITIRCTGGDYIAYLFIALWVLFLLLSQRANNTFNNRSFLSVYLFLMFICVLCTLFGSASNGIGNALRYVWLFIGAFIFKNYKDNHKQLRMLLTLSSIIWAYFVIKSINFYIANPGAARNIMSHQGQLYGYENVSIGGGYGLAFGSALLTVYLFGVLLISFHERKRRTNLLIIIAIIAMLVLCVKVESTITFLAVIIGMSLNVVMLFVCKDGNINIRKRIILSISAILIFVILLMLKDPIGDILMNIQFTGYKVIDSRINEIGVLLKSYELVGDAQLRYNVYIKSIKTIITNPFLGSIAHNGYATTIGVSGHSEVLDVYAMYGWCCGILFTVWYGKNIKLDRKDGYFLNEGYYVTAWILLIANQFTYASATWALFFMIPAFNKMFGYQKT